MQFKMNTN